MDPRNVDRQALRGLILKHKMVIIYIPAISKEYIQQN
jgi:hypothetical protein